MSQIFSTLFYLLVGYVVGLFLAPAGLFSLTIAATQWGNILTWVYLLFWPFILVVHFIVFIAIISIIGIVLFGIYEFITNRT